MAQKAVIALLLLVLAPLAVWWVDSAVGCDGQDQYTLRGVCLMRTKALAEGGDTAAQWVYGLRLQQDEPQAAQVWFKRAAQQSQTGLELSHLHGLCGAVFDKAYVESRLREVARTSPDTHLLLLSLYLDQEHCGTFDLANAVEQVPLLTQCASLNLKKLLDAADRLQQRLAPDFASAIQANIRLCRAELRQQPADWQRTASELLFPDAAELAALENRIGPLLGPAAQRAS